MKNLENFFCDNDTPTFAKVGIYGAAGTGKTRVAYEIASGLYKEKQFTKPVVFFDTEKGSDWILPLFEKENIKCHVKKSRTFADLIKAVELAEQHASILIIDSISHVWRELTQSFLDKYNKERFELLSKKYSKDWAEKNFKKSSQLEFQHWNIIKPTWGKFTEKYLNSNLHVIVCGRAGDMYEYQENENGKKELIKSGTRMATEKELSYEPSLLLELQRRQIETKDRLFAVVEKDRSDAINAMEFELVKYKDLKPHFDFINIGGESKKTDFSKNNSESLFENQTMQPEDEFAAEKRKRSEYSEEIWALFDLKMPGRDNETKQLKLKILQDYFNTMSKSKIENMHSDKLKASLDMLRKYFQDHENK